MKLYGSTTSPYVRRIRLWLNDTDYEFVNMDIFAGPGRALLKEKNPALKVPALEDGEQMVFDSRVIFRYLQTKSSAAPLTWEQENLLTLIDAANDSFVQLMMLKRSGVEQDRELLFFRLQLERIETALTTLNTHAEQGDFSQWDYPTICLFCLIDWVSFRELWGFAAYPALQALWKTYQDDSIIKATDPRI